jgi:hypothetical protein
MDYRKVNLLVLLGFIFHHHAWHEQCKISLKEAAFLSQTFQENAGTRSFSFRLSHYIMLYRLVTRRHISRVIDNHLIKLYILSNIIATASCRICLVIFWTWLIN